MGNRDGGVAAAVLSTPTKKEDPDIEKLRQELAGLEEELKKISGDYTAEELATEDSSIYVGNVDYSASAEDLETFFLKCGDVNRCTIMCNKMTGQPMGYAYIEFAKDSSVSKALELNDSLFKGRQLKVLPKRINMPGYSWAARGRSRVPPSPSRRGFSPAMRRPRLRGYFPSYPSYRGYAPRCFRPRRRFSRGYHPYGAYY
jgi:polyadenylate-binding protein 2